ncbi:Uncharacterized protein TCM_046152 [Theobroma cacao]|uniref:Disease resistance R13L4/SHOC-2-like LRR domain-containing protein n=1 Tax=Theobroma cacao TaxID=3641 RepID=S1RWM5_THECC|nr:Uncharacterized protein TCM_046152 [Theobroma cacao]
MSQIPSMACHDSERWSLTDSLNGVSPTLNANVSQIPSMSHPNIRDLAQEVAKECGGLPLALVTIGCAMACKTTCEEWKYAIEVLRRSSATSIFQGMGEEIACTCEAEKWKFFVQAGYQLTKVPNVGKWRGIKRMSLMDNKIGNLREAPNCPDLQTLFLRGNKPLEVIDNDFFQFMCVLKVLDLSENIGITEFPMGISKLVSLEYLDLSGTTIRELPTELRALKKLKCLGLQHIDNRIKIPRGLMPGFSKLEILRMYGSYPFDEAMEDDNECLAEELQCLNHLNVLTLSVTSVFALDRFLSAERLHNFIETIGLQYFKDSKQLNILSLANFKSLNTLLLEECESLKEVKTVWEGEGRIIKAAIEIQTSMIASVPCFQSLLHVRIDKS